MLSRIVNCLQALVKSSVTVVLTSFSSRCPSVFVITACLNCFKPVTILGAALEFLVKLEIMMYSTEFLSVFAPV